ncbi:hypothetical protein K6119_19210 [Paracrocinitomix mangrovi]|uniref:hypothetical protein n=1 Tax=Paracrocinitomix mangrovi TaxID=2862509 RepID=UPI001C8EB6D0|nr:hypothetical protein [Paracrocinitomix mangrovi]UKN01855.1 hypothetical protein K6119_19210 [Paracrocinitomix mangrovi]
MKKLLPLVLIFPFIFASCGKKLIEEGEVTYEITYPYMKVEGFMQAILPKEMTIVFKGSKMKTTIARGTIFSTDVITDESNEYMEMRLDFGDKLYYSELTKDEIKKLKESAPNYEIKETEEQDSVAGMYCRKYTVKSLSSDTLQPGDAWFTEDMAVQNGAWFSAYSSVTGLPVVYDVERYGLMMRVKATSFVKRKVKDSEFERPAELSPVSFATYEEEVQELFDILLE